MLTTWVNSISPLRPGGWQIHCGGDSAPWNFKGYWWDVPVQELTWTLKTEFFQDPEQTHKKVICFSMVKNWLRTRYLNFQMPKTDLKELSEEIKFTQVTYTGHLLYLCGIFPLVFKDRFMWYLFFYSKKWLNSTSKLCDMVGDSYSYLIWTQRTEFSACSGTDSLKELITFDPRNWLTQKTKFYVCQKLTVPKTEVFHFKELMDIKVL